MRMGLEPVFFFLVLSQVYGLELDSIRHFYKGLNDNDNDCDCDSAPPPPPHTIVSFCDVQQDS